MGREGRAGFSPEGMTRGWSLEVGIMGCIENHLGDEQDGRVGFTPGIVRRRDQDQSGRNRE